MSITMDEVIKRWTARRKSALVLENPGQDDGGRASRQFDLPPSEIEGWAEDGERAWKAPCGPSRRTCASSTSAS